MQSQFKIYHINDEKTEVGTFDILVHFRHSKPKKNAKRYTECEIIVKRDGKDEMSFSDFARCMPQDNFIKETGRRISFVHCIDKMAAYFGMHNRVIDTKSLIDITHKLNFTEKDLFNEIA
jgi:hypothetical protein